MAVMAQTVAYVLVLGLWMQCNLVSSSSCCENSHDDADTANICQNL